MTITHSSLEWWYSVSQENKTKIKSIGEGGERERGVMRTEPYRTVQNRTVLYRREVQAVIVELRIWQDVDSFVATDWIKATIYF